MNPMRWTLRLLVVLLLVPLGAGLHPHQAASLGLTCSVSGESVPGVTGQITSVRDKWGPCPGTRLYYGWSGISGKITVPTTVGSLPSYSSVQASSRGVIGLRFANGSDIQVGWRISATSPNKIFTQVRIHYGPTGQTFTIIGRALARGSSSIYRIAPNASCGCFQIYERYGEWLTNVSYRSLGGWTGAAYAFNISLAWGGMLTSYFGDGRRGTNDTLRLRGANGFVDWTPSVGTMRIDRRPSYYQSPIVAHHYFKTFGARS